MGIFAKKIIQYIFESLFLACIFFFIAEFFKTGVMTNYLNYNMILTLTVIFGIIVLVFREENAKVETKFINTRVFFRACIAGALGIVCVFISGQIIDGEGYFGIFSFIIPMIPWVLGFGVALSTYVIFKNDK